MVTIFEPAPSNHCVTLNFFFKFRFYASSLFLLVFRQLLSELNSESKISESIESFVNSNLSSKIREAMDDQVKDNKADMLLLYEQI